jgi:hypothetical protein
MQTQRFILNVIKNHIFCLSVATCFGLIGPLSGNREFIEITALYGLTRQYIYMLLLDVVVFENVHPHFPRAMSMLRRSRSVIYNI